MSTSNTTIARPYARAAFTIAMKHKAIAQWSEFFKMAGAIVDDQRVQQLLQDPRKTPDELYTWISNICAPVLFKEGQNFVKLLAEQRRLPILNSIAKLFAAYRIAQEKTISVNVTSALPLGAAEQQKLSQALTQRLQRDVVLEYQLDPALLGGVVIRADDLVIDGSVRTRLKKLESTLID